MKNLAVDILNSGYGRYGWFYVQTSAHSNVGAIEDCLIASSFRIPDSMLPFVAPVRILM
jgi:hypothetical protein